ncbi:hypothetical protein VTK73DRAFT_1893 [Phialemonium thermophilum]|uniref:3-oxoacyl-[acyl-carrier protein] reductase n=1 Tax=Phialemonium thermophilum TaxID=223376 RepID=A0ABR3Y3M4_9PEZI
MPEVNNDIAGKLALITGASGGIGAACARALWAQDVSVALTYHQNADKATSLAEELKSQPNRSHLRVSVHKVDTHDAESINNLFQEIKAAHGQDGPDILVSNAGHGKRVPNILDITIEEFDFTLSVNLRASVILSKLAIPHMTSRHWGRIIYVSSLAAHGGGINGCHYAASKAGLHGLMRSLANKHAREGITVNDVAPAMIRDTGMIPDERSVEGTPGDVRNIPVGRLGTPEEVANVVLMFCKTGYMTGQSVLVSGGLK